MKVASARAAADVMRLREQLEEARTRVSGVLRRSQAQAQEKERRHAEELAALRRDLDHVYAGQDKWEQELRTLRARRH